MQKVFTRTRLHNDGTSTTVGLPDQTEILGVSWDSFGVHVYFEQVRTQHSTYVKRHMHVIEVGELLPTITNPNQNLIFLGIIHTHGQVAAVYELVDTIPTTVLQSSQAG